MVTLAGLRRRLDHLSTKDDQIFVFYAQEDGSYVVTQPGKAGVNKQHFESYQSACKALALPEDGPAITIQRGGVL